MRRKIKVDPIIAKLEEEKRLAEELKRMNREQEKEYKLKNSIFFVEGNSFESLALWEDYNKKVLWEEDTAQFMQTVGHIYKTRPVVVILKFVMINNQRICFFDPCSQYVDHIMVRNWIVKNYPVKWNNNQQYAITDAMNFHLVLSACTQKTLQHFGLPITLKVKIK